MSHFPSEIYGQIATELSKRDLWTLSLVSPATVDEANRILYRDVDFSSLPVNLLARDPTLSRQQDKPLNCFFRTVSGSRRLASLVNNFAFRTPYHPELDIDPSHAFRSLINLCALSITSILSSDQFPTFLHACTPNLEVLHATFPLNLDFLTFVKSTPKLRLLSFGREKAPATAIRDIDWTLYNKASLLSSLTTLSVDEGAIHLVPFCNALTHLDVRMSERQPVSIALDNLKAVGPQLVSLTWHQGLYYGNEAIVQCLPSLADVTSNLESLHVVVHFCGGWGNPPCAQVRNFPCIITLESSTFAYRMGFSTQPMSNRSISLVRGSSLNPSFGNHVCLVTITWFTGMDWNCATMLSPRCRLFAI
jgi:hypothetical protein